MLLGILVYAPKDRGWAPDCCLQPVLVLLGPTILYSWRIKSTEYKVNQLIALTPLDVSSN